MRILPLLLVLVAMPVQAEDLGLKVPPNFKVTLWADHTLANDIYTMALDEQGRVVVSGPGYIRRLEDTDGDGKADKATDIAETKTGAMGLLFAPGLNAKEFDLYCSSDGRLRKLTKVLGEEKLVDTASAFLEKFPFSEHGGHALKISPDDTMHTIAGNSTALSEFEKDERNLIRKPEGGGILRFPWKYSSEVELIAHGFRNPYDFDFTPNGDMITFDSDSERDYLLPWYSPTRVYHVMPGAHHGWRLPGGMRSLARRDYYPDTVPMLADLGRGSPTGVCCYRHTQFPTHYRGGVFLLDWTFGKIHYLPLIPEGLSYKQVKPELFLEPTGTNGFAPTAARVGPDGSLYVSIGGRGTRGAVYRIEFQTNRHPLGPKTEAEMKVDKVLNAPQPLEAWSMAKWLPLLKTVGSQQFANVAANDAETLVRRFRAIECILVLGHTIGDRQIFEIGKSNSPMVRARLAWALGRMRRGLPALRSMSEDPDPRVLAEVIHSMVMHHSKTPELLTLSSESHGISFERLSTWMRHDDQRVRLAATRLFPLLAKEALPALESRVIADGAPRSLITFIAGRSQVVAQDEPKHLFPLAIKSLLRAKTVQDQLEAIRLTMQSLGDWKIHDPRLELFIAYSLSSFPDQKPGYERLLANAACGIVHAFFPSADARLNIEASRLLAMLEDGDPASISKMLAQITADSHPTWDFHYLTVLARLTAPRNQSQTHRVADALLSLEGKLERRNLRAESNWPARLRELVVELLRTHPGLDKLIVAHEKLVAPGHVLIASQLRLEARQAAARLFFAAVRDNTEYPLSGELIQLLTTLPAEEVRSLLRSRWADRSVRDAIIKPLAAKPEEIDRAKFLEALETGQGEATCLTALKMLPRDDSPKNLVPLFARLRQAVSDPKERGIRKQLVELVNRQTGQAFAIEESKTALGESYQPLFAWFEQTHPSEAKRLTTASEDEAAIRNLAKSADWGAGNAARGIKVFDRLGCQACHGNSTRLGPDLAGSGKRMSRDDLLTAILNPSRDVAPIYRVTNIETKDNKRISGLIAYDSSEALLVQLGTGETKRIAVPDIESRLPSMKSLMPDGLLKGIKPEDLADLFAFLARQ